MRFEDLAQHRRVGGVVPGELVTVLAVGRHGPDAVALTYQRADGSLAQRLLYRSTDEEALFADDGPQRAFDADPADFRLAAEAQRIRMAGIAESMTAVATSDVEPLPHQIRAVYGPLLHGAPLRFLLADDPGAGKTIMAGLYIKELLLRDDVRRCLIVAPGGLVEQWQDELAGKFGLRFEILTLAMLGAGHHAVFEEHPLLIARMDQLVRNEELAAELARSSWDLAVVDEAHRMSAHYYGGEINRTRRFELGETLGRTARHLLLMTATPHAGKEEDFQLFLTLLDRDQFEGRFQPGVHDRDTSTLMRRMIKEDLLTFEGRRLFPERVAETVPYRLTEAEAELYEQVTDYVRREMNRAARLQGGRRNTVGFALTVLQRRLASSPEAIYQSLNRRVGRLERLRQQLLNGEEPTGLPSADLKDYDQLDDVTADERETMENDVVDAATAARTAVEVAAELEVLRDLVIAARRVRESGTDRKWNELRTILHNTGGDADLGSRKIIIFTEHRDTLEYLVQRIGSVLGRPEAVQAIHGGVSRRRRREITEEFTKNPECQVLVATDAAGEGLNLQVAHLMVNYDLPWNPNRIEQRFGRIHRIGQREVCRLWNLVAANTREGEVFTTLLSKIEEQRKAYGGKVFDVLGKAFAETPLRTLLVDAIQYGEQPEVRARMEEVIDRGVSDGLQELLAEQSLAQPAISVEELERMRREMAEAKARRLQPHYIEQAFRSGFARFGGRLARREAGRFEITHVPASLRTAVSRSPIPTRYERVTFALDRAEVEGTSRADLLAPGHALHDAVMLAVIEKFGVALDRGTVLVSGSLTAPQLLVGLREDVVDGAGTELDGRFGYVMVDAEGTVTEAGPAPYLDLVAAPESPSVAEARSWGWLTSAEDAAVAWSITRQLPAYLEEQRCRRVPELTRVREKVSVRLHQEINRLATEAVVASDLEGRGEKPRESSELLMRRSSELDARLQRRLAELDTQTQLTTRPPRVVSAAIVVPVAMVSGYLPPDAPIRAVATAEVERRGVDAVLAAERTLGQLPEEQAHNNKGFDVLSARGETVIHLEVKARIEGADVFFISHTEALHSLNMGDDYRLALVRVDQRGAQFDEVRYVSHPFAGNDFSADTDYEQHTLSWAKTWAKGAAPF